MELHEVDSKTLIVEVMSLIGKRGLTMSSEFALLLTTFATLQALGTSVDPRFHFVDSVSPFARRLVEEQMKPEAIFQDFVSTIRRAGRALQNLPDSITRALQARRRRRPAHDGAPRRLRPAHVARRGDGRPARVRAGRRGVRGRVLDAADARGPAAVDGARSPTSRSSAPLAWACGSSRRSSSGGSGSGTRTTEGASSRSSDSPSCDACSSACCVSGRPLPPPRSAHS